MLKVQVTPRKVVYVEMEEDTKPNKGGYFCTIYGDDTHDFPMGSFVIHNYDLTGEGEERKKKALVAANFKAKEYCKR